VSDGRSRVPGVGPVVVVGEVTASAGRPGELRELRVGAGLPGGDELDGALDARGSFGSERLPVSDAIAQPSQT
jgi:hypothetical protein